MVPEEQPPPTAPPEPTLEISPVRKKPSLITVLPDQPGVHRNRYFTHVLPEYQPHNGRSLGTTYTGNSFLARGPIGIVTVFFGAKGSLWRMADRRIDRFNAGQISVCPVYEEPKWISVHALAAERLFALSQYLYDGSRREAWYYFAQVRYQSLDPGTFQLPPPLNEEIELTELAEEVQQTWFFLRKKPPIEAEFTAQLLLERLNTYLHARRLAEALHERLLLEPEVPETPDPSPEVTHVALTP